MGKAQDFLNSEEALDVAAAADPAGAQVAETQVAAPETVAAPEERYEPLGAQAEHPAFAGLDAAVAQAQPGAAPDVQVGAQPAAAAQAQGAAIRDRLVNELGLQALADAPDDWSAVQQVFDYAQQRDQYARELAAQMQTLQGQVSWLQQQQQFAQQQAAQPGAAAAQAAAAAAPQTPAPTWPKAPEWDPAWEAGLTRHPETGEIVAKPGYDQSLPQKYSQRKAWEQATINQLLSDPIGFADKSGIFSAYDQRQQAAIAKLREEMKQEYAAQLRAVQEEQFGQQFGQQHAGWMFQHDLSGRPMVDPRTGRTALTQEGQQVIQTAEMLTKAGIQNPRLAMQLAYNMVSGAGSVAEAAANELNAAMQAYTQGQPAAGQVLPPVAQPGVTLTPQQQQQQAFLQRTQAMQQATRQPSRSGAPADPKLLYERYKGLDKDQVASKLFDDVAANLGAFEQLVAN
jgi:hypothetical protein